MQKVSTSFKTLRKKWKLILFLLVVIAIGGWVVRSRAQANQPKLTFATIQRGNLVKKLEISGIIDAKEKASLRFLNGGKITYLGAKEGDQIKKWQTIARIDPQELQKRLQQDLNTFFNERMDFEQGRETRKDKAITTTDERVIQKDQKDLENQVLNVEIRDIAIRNTVLSSPVEGVLVSAPTAVANVNLGPTDSFEVVNPKTLVFRASVDEADISSVKKGQTGEITLDAFPDDPIKTTVNYIAYKSAQSTTGTVFLVELPIPVDFQFPLLERYRLGMNGDARIVLAEKNNVLSVPVTATKERDGKTYVTVSKGKQNGKVITEEKEISVGLETDEAFEVTAGLNEGDQVLIP